MGLILVCHIFGLPNTLADDDVDEGCCPSLTKFNEELLCADGTAAAPFCGIGKCDDKGCNCEEGCRTDMDFGDENTEEDHQEHEHPEQEHPEHEHTEDEHKEEET